MSLFKKRFRQESVPELNTTSTADISFMLLILFLVTTSMDSNLGIMRMLPKLEQQKQEKVQTYVDKRNVFTLNISAEDEIIHNDKKINVTNIVPLLKEFILNPNGKSYLSESPEKHIIMLCTDETAHYDTYFQLQNAIIRAYKEVRDETAKIRYGEPFAALTERQQQSIKETIPQRVLEK